jgi:hypothetical protein
MAARVAAASLLLGLPLLFDPPEADAQLVLAIVRLQDGRELTLYDPHFGLEGGGRERRGGAPGGLPPGVPPGRLPGNAPGAGGFGNRGDDPYRPQPQDPRQPTHDTAGRPIAGRYPVGIPLDEGELRRLRRIDILSTRRGTTHGDLLFTDGTTRHDVRMNWDNVTGSAKARGRGRLHSIEAKKILSIEFPQN